MKYIYPKDKNGNRLTFATDATKVIRPSGATVFGAFTDLTTNYTKLNTTLDAVKDEYSKVQFCIKGLKSCPRGRILIHDNKGNISSDYGYKYNTLTDMLNSNDLSELCHGDMIHIIDIEGNESYVQANIDTYYGKETDYKHHIDFIGRDCINASYGHFMNNSETNNGTNKDATPFVTSTLYDYLNTTIYGKLSNSLKAHIIEKMIDAPIRYSIAGLLTDDTDAAFSSVGNLWIPFESEILMNGYSTPKYGSVGMHTYPVFQLYPETIIKHRKPEDETLTDWWTASPTSGTQYQYCYVSRYGMIGRCSPQTSTVAVPLCFRFI